MRVHTAIALALLLSLPLQSCTGAGSAPTSPTPVTNGSADSSVDAFVELVNAHRRAQGLAALVWDETAAAVALAHSEDMATRDFFSHTNPDGASPFDRMASAGIVYVRAGENIAYGYKSAQAVFDAWMASPGHRANIEDAAFTHHGVGRFGNYWTHVFFTPRSS